MNEEALKDAYGLFTDTGYNGSMEQFSTLMRDNEEARNDAFKLFTDTGYNGAIEDFSSLIIGDEVIEEEVVEETTFDPFKPAGLSEKEYTSTKELIKEIPSTKRPEVKEKEVIKKEDKKDISFEDFDGVSEEDLVVKLRKQYGFDRFEFDQDTPGSDVLQIYDNTTEEYHYLPLNTQYNKDKRTYQTPENAGQQTYTDFLKIINTGKEDKVVEVSKVKDGKITKEEVQEEFTGGTGTGYYIEIDKSTNDNPYIADPGTTKKINVEVPQHYVDKAIDAMAHHSNKDKEWNTSLDAAIQHVYEEDKNMEGALRFQNQMMGEQSNEDKKINALIQETVAEKGFIANPFDGFFGESLAQADESGMIEETKGSYEDFYIHSQYANDISKKDPIIEKYYKLGLPPFELEEKYQIAKKNWEIAEGRRDPKTRSQEDYQQYGPTAYEQYVGLASERAKYLKEKINTWSNDDPIGQRVFDANQAQLEKEAANSNIDEITNNVKLNNPDASDEQIKSIVDDQIESGIEEGVINAFNANSFGEGLDLEQKNIINSYYDKFTTRTEELNTNRSEAIVKYMSEGKSPAYARELANKDFPVTQEDIKLQNEYLSYVQQVADDDNLKIYKTINGDYEDVSFSQGTLEERANPDYYKNKIKEYQYEDPDFLNRRIYANNNKLIALAKQLETRNLEWTTEVSLAQNIYNTIGEDIGSDESLAADIRRFSEIANTGKLPDNLTTIPNSNSPLVKAWNDAVENRAVLGMGKMLNVNLSTLERESASVIMSDVLPAFDAESLSPNEARRRWFEQMQADGIILNKEQKFQMNEQIDSYEKAFGQVPDLFAMGIEMGATFLMTGGAGNVANLTKTVIGKILQQGVKVGLSPKVIKSVTKYASAVATEVYALEGSSFSRENIFDTEGMSLGHNIRLATTLNLGRGIIAKTGDMYTKAIINTAKKQAKLGNKTLQNVVNFARTTPGLESFTGALNFAVTKPLTAAALLQVEGGIENIVAGESFNKLWHDITDGDALMETYGAMLTMQLSHPTAAWKGAVETFRREVDRTRGDNPAWNSAYRELGLKPKKGDEFHTKEDVDNAVNEKIKNIEDSNLGKEQKQELIDYHKRLGGKLNMKPAMIELSESWKEKFETSKDAIAQNEYNKKYDELSPEQKKQIDKDFKSDPLFEANENLQNTIKSLEGGNSLDATDVMNLSAAGKMNGNKAPVTELMSIGYSQPQALSITTSASVIAQQTRNNFSQNPAAIASKQGREFTNNLIELNKRQSQVNNLENILTGDGKNPGLIKQFGENSIEVKQARKSIEQANKAIEQIQENLSNSSKAQWEKENLDFKTIEDAKEAGAEVVELKTDAEVKEFLEEFPDKSLSETGFGYQGPDLRERIRDEDGTLIDNPNHNKAIFIVNTKRIAEEGVKGTAIHEIIGHGTTEIIVGDAAINKRARAIQLENPNMAFGAAKKIATNEKLDYIDNVRIELKKRGGSHYEKVEEQMMKRPGYEEYKKSVDEGGKRDIKMEKEFLAEFVQLAEQKAFAGSKGIRGEITEVTSLKPSSKPSEWVDFVLKGGTTAKGGRVKAIEESIKELDRLTKRYGTKDSKFSASEKIVENNKRINEEILNSEEYKKSLERGKEEVPQEYKDELVNNNLARVHQLSSKAKNNPNFFGEGASYDQWIGGYYEQLVKLANTYKPSNNPIKRNKKGEVISRGDFGAYMNKNLPLRYGDVLKKLTAGETKGPSKRIGEPTAEGGREFDIKSEDLTPEERMIAKEKAPESKEKGDRQISVFEGKEAKAKEKEILDIFEKVKEDKTDLQQRSKKGLAGTPKEDLGKVGELLFDIPGSKITDGAKNITYAKKIINPKTGKPIKKGEKGIPEPSEMGNIQKYFSDIANLEQALKTLPPENITGNKSIINKQGEIIDVSRDVKGKGLKLPKRFLDYFYEKTGKRSQGLKSQTPVWKLKNKFINPTPETLKEIQKDLLIGEDINLYERAKHGQLAKGLALVESMKVSNEATRKGLPQETKEQKQLVADIKAGASEFAASEKLLGGISKLFEEIKKGKTPNVNSLAKQMGIKGGELKVFKSIPLPKLKEAIKNKVVTKFILNELIKNDLASPKAIRVIEDITIADIARREKITTKEVKERYFKNAWHGSGQELKEALGLTYRSAKKRGSVENFKESKPYIKDLIQRMIPKGKTFSEMPKSYQEQLLKTLGFGEGKQLTNGRKFTFKEYPNVPKGEYNTLLKKVFNFKDSDLKGKGSQSINEWASEFFIPSPGTSKGKVLDAGIEALTLEGFQKKAGKEYYRDESSVDKALDANKLGLQEWYKAMKEVVKNAENPQKALDHIIDFQLSQTNRSTGAIKGLVGMESATTRGARGQNIERTKEVHNEHLAELFSMTKDFSLALDRYLKGEQSSKGLDLQLKRMTEDANQALISEQRREYKDFSGSAKRDYFNNLVFLGRDSKTQIPLRESTFAEAKNMAEVIRNNATKALIEQIKNTPFEKLTEAAILVKQYEASKPNYNKIGRETVSLVKEASMSVKPSRFSASEKMSASEGREKLRIRDKAFELARKINKPVKKARVFDFDDTVARTKSNVLYEMPNGKKGKMSAEEFAKRGGEMEAKGAKWDFSEFNKVVDGKKGPLFEVMKKMKEAAGERDMFILTARSPEAAKAIHKFLKEMGIDIPLENIKGLGDSSPFAKSDWILEKASEGYNDFYFADDHAPNVKAVKDALSRLDVKGKTQQAKVKFSASIKKNLEKNENYKKFRDLISKEKLFHGGSETLGDFNAVWFVTGDVKGAWSYAVENDSRVYSVEAKDLKDTIIIPDMNDAKGFYDFAKEKFPKQIDAIQNRAHGSNRLLESVDIKRVLEQPNASEILNEFVDWSQDNFKMGAFPLGSNRGVNSIYDGKSITKGLPVIVVKRPSNWESNPKLVTEVSMRDVYREEKAQKEKDIRQEKRDARKEKINKVMQRVLNVVDIKRPVQKDRMSASIKLDKDFNKILEEKSGIEWYKDFSKSKGKVVGARKGKYKIFLPPGAEDFTGLIYPTLGKGKKGEAQLEWYNDNLIKPYNRATRNLATDKVQLMNDFKGLKKQLEMPKDLRKITKSGYTKEQAARVYLWDKMGEKIPNLTKTDLAELLDIVNSDGKLKAFADQILEATKGDGYSTPGENWLSGTMTTDLIDVLNVNKRKKYLEEWQENIDIIYSEKNLNKLEAIYGPKYREALENSIKRMKTGRNRTSTGNKASDALLDYINGAQGTIMFLNMRSAVLQSISAANFVNLSFNNPIKAGKAFINQKQYWKDFMSIMNSDYLVGRRQGLKLNISESEIADAAAGSKNKAKAAINYILEKGYAPTKFMDSFAIASGGATWYRNKIKDLMKKEGLSEVEAQKKAFEEFMEISEKSQQSSDPSKISKQQSSDMGRIFLQFANTPMQYARIQKRALQDLANKRGDWKSNIGKILYYGVIQNIWFNAMQQGLFALGFGDDEINEKEEKKIVDTANGMADSILRGTGFAGMTISVLKNTIIDLYRRSGRQQPKYGDAWMKLLEFSPAVKSKFGKLKSAAWPFDTKKGREEIKEKGFSLDNPAFESGAKVISAATNIPLDRLFLKYNNLKAMMSEDTETWKDIALFLGWPEYQLEEGGTVEEDNIRNMKNDTKKDEQIQMLLDLGYSKRQIRSQFKKEEDRVKAIINSKSGKKVKRKRVIY